MNLQTYLVLQKSGRNSSERLRAKSVEILRMTIFITGPNVATLVGLFFEEVFQLVPNTLVYKMAPVK